MIMTRSKAKSIAAGKKAGEKLKEDIENIRVGFICIEGTTYDISPAITACIIDMLNEIDELEKYSGLS